MTCPSIFYVLLLLLIKIHHLILHLTQRLVAGTPPEEAQLGLPSPRASPRCAWIPSNSALQKLPPLVPRLASHKIGGQGGCELHIACYLDDYLHVRTTRWKSIPPLDVSWPGIPPRIFPYETNPPLQGRVFQHLYHLHSTHG